MSAIAQTYTGRSVPRVEDPRLLTGAGRYGADFDCVGQLHARFVRSDVAHGRIKGIDASALEGRPGIVRVFTSADLPGDVRIPIRLFATEHAEQALQPALARDKVRYVGDPIAIVVATDPYLAEDAAEEVRVDIEPLAPVLDPWDAAEGSGPTLHETLDGNLIDRSTITHHGDKLDELFENAAVVVTERFSIQRHGAVPMETRSLLSEYDPGTGQLTVWGAAKVKHFNRRILANLLGVDELTIRCIEGDVGGGFGARGEFYPEDYLIPWMAMQLGRPVKWVEDRRENLVALNHSREQVWEISYAADADGRLLAFKSKALFNQGGYVRTHGSVLLPNLMLNHIVGPYRWQAYETTAASVLTNKTPAGTYRGPGQYEPTFVRERMVDLVARELGLDSVEIRRRNLIEKHEMPWDSGLPDVDTGKPMIYDEGDFHVVLEDLLQKVGYEDMRKEVDRRRAAGDKVGLAVTSFIEMGNPGIFEQARMVAESDGTFTAHVGIASVGQGIETVLSQLGADLLGVPMDRMRLSYQDTAIVPEGQGAFSSRGTVWGGYAIAGAIRVMLDNARKPAAERLGVDPEDVVFEGGYARAGETNGGQGIPLGELGVEGLYRYEPEGGSHILMGSNVAMVEVDPDAGSVKLLRYGISYEVGKVINPLTLEGQVRGAAAQGIGGALLEEFAYTPEGQPLCTSFMDYALPTAAEIPDFDVVLVEMGEMSESDPIAGAKGAGEGGIIATAATIANAVADAMGRPPHVLTSLPLTPEAVQRLSGSGA